MYDFYGTPHTDAARMCTNGLRPGRLWRRLYTMVRESCGMLSCVGYVRVLAMLVAVAAAAGCATNTRRALPPGTSQPDKFLFDRGTTELSERHWLTAREFFKQVTETYTQSPL